VAAEDVQQLPALVATVCSGAISSHAPRPFASACRISASTSGGRETALAFAEFFEQIQHNPYELPKALRAYGLEKLTTSLGGMKPKLTIEHEGALWITKFSERNDPPVQRVLGPPQVAEPQRFGTLGDPAHRRHVDRIE
jgi:hypothetical protein